MEGFDEDLPFDLFNTVTALLAILLSLQLAFVGFNTLNSIAITLVGTIFAIALIVGVLFSRGSVLTGPSTFQEASFAFVLGAAIFLVPQFTGGGFSTFSTPTSQGAYLSIIGNTPQIVQILANNILAPVVETLVILAIAAILTRVLETDLGVSLTVSVAASSAFGAAFFAFLHGTRSTGFFVLAFIFMFVSLFIVLGADTDTFDIPLLPASIAFLVGLHFGNNLAASFSSPFEFVSVLLGTTGPFNISALLVVAWLGVILVGAGLFVFNRYT